VINYLLSLYEGLYQSNSSKGKGFTAPQAETAVPSGSVGHPQKDSYYLGTKVLWESMW